MLLGMVIIAVLEPKPAEPDNRSRCDGCAYLCAHNAGIGAHYQNQGMSSIAGYRYVPPEGHIHSGASERPVPDHCDLHVSLGLDHRCGFAVLPRIRRTRAKPEWDACLGGQELHTDSPNLMSFLVCSL